MAISKLLIKQSNLASIVTVLRTRNSECTNVRADPFFVPENQCTQILNLSSPGAGTKAVFASVQVAAEKKRLFRYECKQIIIKILIKLVERCPLPVQPCKSCVFS